MRRILPAAGAVFALAVAAPAYAVTDPTGDFLPTFVGAQDADLDVIDFTVVFDEAAATFAMHATLAGDIDPSRFGLYVIGVNTGTGPIAPFGNIGNPNVRFNQVAVVFKTGATNLAGITALIDGASFDLVVPLALFPSTGFTPLQYGFNLWPRNGGDPTNNAQISDFAPDNATQTASVPEPAAWALMIAGFGLAGGMLRRRNMRAAVPV